MPTSEIRISESYPHGILVGMLKSQDFPCGYYPLIIPYQTRL